MPITADLPKVASAQQRSFWLANEFDPGTCAFNLIRTLRLTGAIDQRSLARAFNGLIARHDVLRTGLVENDGKLLQYVHDHVELRLEEHDISDLPDPERSIKVDGLAKQMFHTAFDLAVPPHFRAALVRLTEQQHLLIVVFHHVIIDGSTMGRFFDELATFYEAERSGTVAPLPQLAIQYGDFSLRQELQYDRITFEKGVAFWRKTLEGAPPLLALPTIGVRPAVQLHRGRRLTFKLDRVLGEAFRALCSSYGSTPFMGFFSAFQILLQRWADTDDVIVGTAMTGSRDQDLKPLIGCFVNTLALRGDLSGDPTFAELLKRNRSLLLDAFEYQQIPFETIVAEVGHARTRQHSPIFQVMFVYHNFGHSEPTLNGIVVEEVECDPGVAQMDLTFDIEEKDQFVCSIEYDCELFDGPMMERMIANFRQILESVVSAPDRPISNIGLLSRSEWQRTVFDWNSTKREYPQRGPVASFVAAVAQQPNAIALISEGHQITFAELARRAGQVVTVLRNTPRDGDPIGILLPRSFEAFAAILGCLMAGVPWVPLDPAQPDKRLAQLIELAGCKAILTFRALTNRLPRALSTILLDKDAHIWSGPVGAPELTSSVDLAYVLFTSGSTGVPKGVMGSTKALMNRIDWMHEAYPFARGEVACCKTSIGFVDSLWEMFGPLLSGVPTVIIPDDILLDPEAFVTLLYEQRVTRIVLVPTLLRVLLDHIPTLGTRLPMLKTWSVSGEMLAPDLVRRFRRACPGRLLINLYGSSEVAADVLVHEIEDADIDGPIPIGRPIANTEVYILDRAGQPTPIGLPGTIYAGGACLALGYWRRPQLTAERFQRTDHVGAKSKMLFNTGDRGVYRADGTIVYLGRTDSQVKLRGVRIELGEILTALRSHSSVKDAAAVVVSDADQQRLIAFFVGHHGNSTTTTAQLRAHLRERLPSAAVPDKIISLDALPLLPSGKVDQVALGALVKEPTRHEASTNSASVNGDVASIWKDVLHEEVIAAGDDFFALGGNSLLAMQVIDRVRRQFGVDIAIRALFDNSTLAEFSIAVETAPRARYERFDTTNGQAKTELDRAKDQLARLSPEQLRELLASVKQNLA